MYGVVLEGVVCGHGSVYCVCGYVGVVQYMLVYSDNSQPPSSIHVCMAAGVGGVETGEPEALSNTDCHGR